MNEEFAITYESLRAELATYESCVSPETMLHAPLVSHVQSLCRPESLPTDIRHHGSAADQTGGTLSVYTGASYAPLLVLVTISMCNSLFLSQVTQIGSNLILIGTPPPSERPSPPEYFDSKS